MKKVIILLGVTLLLMACTNEAANEANKSLEIKPADFSEREKSIVNQTGVDHSTFYTVDGEVKDGEVLDASIEVYEEGEGGVVLSSEARPDDNNEFADTLHSFQILMEEKQTYLTIGEGSGYARGDEFMPVDLIGFSFNQFEESITLKKGEPVYLSYLIGTSENELTVAENENRTSLPGAVEDAEYAIVFKLELKDSNHE